MKTPMVGVERSWLAALYFLPLTHSIGFLARDWGTWWMLASAFSVAVFGTMFVEQVVAWRRERR